MQNGDVERFNRSFRHEVLDALAVTTLSQVRDGVREWLISDNKERPHKSSTISRQPCSANGNPNRRINPALRQNSHSSPCH